MCVTSELTFNCSWCHVLQRYLAGVSFPGDASGAGAVPGLVSLSVFLGVFFIISPFFVGFLGC